MIISLSLSPLFQHGFFFSLLAFTLYATLTVQEFPVALHEVLWYVVRPLGRVFRCGISVLTDYVTDAILCVERTDDMIDDVHIGAICSFSCRRAVFNGCMRLISCRLRR